VPALDAVGGHASCYSVALMKKAASPPESRLSKTPAKRSATKTPRKATPPRVAKPEPTEADIARRAYEIFLAREGAPGDPLADWIQAEIELKSGR
jgi:hypothetical protein